jgi:rare lipoprotein A (peptidoglycan hydrolase)
MIQYETSVDGRLKFTLNDQYREIARQESGGNMSLRGTTNREQSPYGVVAYKHDTRKYSDFVQGLENLDVIQFAAPFNNVQKSLSSQPNIATNILESAYENIGLVQRMFPSEVGMLMRTGKLKSLLHDQTYFKSTVQQPIGFYDQQETVIKNQYQASRHQNKDGSNPLIIGHDPLELQHAKSTEGLYSKERYQQIKEEFAAKGLKEPVPTGKAQFTGAMFTDLAVGGLSLSGSGGVLGQYEDYSIGFENPTIVDWISEFRKTGLEKEYFVRESEAARGVKVTGNLSIYEERNKQLRDVAEILKIVDPKGEKGLAQITVGSPSMDWNEFARDSSSKDARQKQSVGTFIKLLQETAKYGSKNVLIMDPSRINIPENEQRRLKRSTYIGKSIRGKAQHSNTMGITMRPITGLTPEQTKLLEAKGLLEKAKTGVHTLNVGNARPTGNYSINQEIIIDMNKADAATRAGAAFIEANIAASHVAFLPRRDIAKEGIAGSMLQQFYMPTFKDSQKSGFTQEGLLPNMPLSMPQSFFRYFKPGTRTHIYSDRYRALTGKYATGLQGDVLRELDAKLSDPGPGNQINYFLRQRDLYEPGKGIIGTAAATVGRFIDTATGFYTMQAIKARESGQLGGSLRELYEKRQYDPYDQTENRGFFENLLTKTAGTLSATTTAMAAYFGVTHAYTMARAQIEQVGVDYVLESIARGHTEGVKSLFITQLLDPSHQELILGASTIYNADIPHLTVRNTGTAMEAYFNLTVNRSLQALQHTQYAGIITDEMIEAVASSDTFGDFVITDSNVTRLNSQIMGDSFEAVMDPTSNKRTMAAVVTRKLSQKLAALPEGAVISESTITPLIDDIYKEMGIDRQSGLIDLGRGTDSLDIKRGTQPAGFSNLAGVRRMDSSNLQHMFLPLLDDMVFDKGAKKYQSAKQNLLRLAQSTPALTYKNTANNIAAASDLRIYNYGYERMRQLAEVFDELATHLPANPLMWIKPIREVFAGSPTTGATTEQTIEHGAITTTRASFKDLIGPGFTGLINIQGEIVREVGRSMKVGLTQQLKDKFELLQTSRAVERSEADLVKQVARHGDVESFINTIWGNDVGDSMFLGHVNRQRRYNQLLRNQRKDYDELLNADTANPAFSGLRKALLGVGTVMIVDRLFDAYVLRPQGVDYFDSVMSDVIGSRSPKAGSEEDAKWQSLYDTEYSNAIPSIIKYPAAAAGFFVGGHLLPSYEATDSLVYEAVSKKYGVAAVNTLMSEAAGAASDDVADALRLSPKVIRSKFGTAGALLGASAALIGSQLAVNYLSAISKPVIRGLDNLFGGRWREEESGLDVDPVKGTAASALANIVQYSVQRQSVNYQKGWGATAEDKTDVYLLNLAAQGLMQSRSKPTQMFYPFATQIASPFFQFATVAKVDPGKNIIQLNTGFQLFPLLGAGLMLPSPITPKVQYTAPLSNRAIANYLKNYPEGIIMPGQPSTMAQHQETEAFVNMQELSKTGSMLLGGGVNLSFDGKPLVYMAMLGAASEFAKSGVDRFLAYKAEEQKWLYEKRQPLYRELQNYETLFHAGRVGLDTLDRVSRAAYSLSVIMPNYLAKAGSAFLGASGGTMHQLGPFARKAAPFALAFGLLGASFRLNDKAMESELPNYSRLQTMFKQKQYEGLTHEMIKADAINIGQVFVGTGLLGTTILSTGAFESARSFGNAYNIVEAGGPSTYIQRQKHKLYSMWLEHLQNQGEVLMPSLEGQTVTSLSKRSVATAEQALGVYGEINQAVGRAGQMQRRHLMKAASQIDLPLIRTAPTRLAMAARRVAPVMVGALAVAQVLATTEGFKDSPWLSLLKNFTSTGSSEYSSEQRAMLTKLGINQPRYQPKNLGDAFNNVRDYVVSSALLPFGGNTFGVYQDNPNPFSPIIGPLGLSLGSEDEARVYSQSQSVAADISGSLYLMPAMTNELANAMNLGPLLSYAKKLEKRPGAASLAKALIRGAGLRTKAAKFKGGPSQSDMQAVSSPELQMALTRRYDRLRNLSWQTSGELMMDVIGEFQRSGRIISDYRDGRIDGTPLNKTTAADTMIYDTLGKMRIVPIGSDGSFRLPKKTTERDLLKFIRTMTAQGAGFGEGVRLEASEDPADIMYGRSQDRGGIPVLSYFGGLFNYAFNSFYDKDTDLLTPDSSNIVGATLMAGSALVLGASFIGTSVSTVIQLAGSLAALSEYGTISDAKTSVRDLRMSVVKKLKQSSFALSSGGGPAIIRPRAHGYSRVLTPAHDIAEETLEQINLKFTGNTAFNRYTSGNALETIVTEEFGNVSRKLANQYSTVESLSDFIVQEVDVLNAQLGDQLNVVVGGESKSIASIFTPGSEAIQGIDSKALTEINQILVSGKHKQTQALEIERVLLNSFHRNLGLITAEGQFVNDGKLPAHQQSAKTQYAKEAAKQAVEQQAAALTGEVTPTYDPSIGFLRSKIQEKGYSGLIAEGTGGALRAAGELINLKAYYEVLSYTAAMGTTDQFERRRASQAAAQNTVQAFGLIIPMQYALGAVRRHPAIAMTVALGAAVAGGVALQNKGFRRFLEKTTRPVFSFLDTYAYKPAVQGLAGMYEGLAKFTPLPQLLRPVTAIFDPIFSGMRRAVQDDPALSMLANFFVPEGVEDFYRRNALLKTRMTPWGDSYEMYSKAEVGQYRAARLTAKRRRARTAQAGIDEDLLHPFLMGRSADVQSISLFEERYLGGDGRIMEQFQTERLTSNLMMMAIRRRQGLVDQHVGGSYMRQPYYKENVHHHFATVAALGTYSYAQTGDVFSAPVNQATRGLEKLYNLHAEIMNRLGPEAGPIIKRTLAGAALGYLAGAQFSHFGETEDERRRNAAIGGLAGSAIGGSTTLFLGPHFAARTEYILSRLGRNPFFRGIAGKAVAFGSAVGNVAKATFKGLGAFANKSFPYASFWGLSTAATYSNYDAAVNWVDGEDPAKKHPLYNPWVKLGISTGVGAVVTLAGYGAAGSQFTSGALAAGIGKSAAALGTAGGYGANWLLSSFLINFMLSNPYTGAAPRALAKTIYDRFGLGRDEDFGNFYNTGVLTSAAVVGSVTPWLSQKTHEDYITRLQRQLGYTDVDADGRAQRAVAELDELKRVLAAVEGTSGAVVAASPESKLQQLGIAPLVGPYNHEYVDEVIQQGIAEKRGRMSLVESLIDAQVQRGFLHNTLRSTKGILKATGHIGTLGFGYVLKGLAKTRRNLGLGFTIMGAGTAGGYLFSQLTANDTDSGAQLETTVSTLGGTYIAAGLYGAFGRHPDQVDVAGTQVIQRLTNWYTQKFGAGPDAPRYQPFRAAWRSLPRKFRRNTRYNFNRGWTWLKERFRDPRSSEAFPDGFTFGRSNFGQQFMQLKDKALPVAAFSIDVLNLYTSTSQINNLKYARSQADFMKAYSSYSSVVATTTFTSLMSLFARNASFSSFAMSTLQMSQISYAAGMRRSDYEYANAVDDPTAFQADKQKDFLMAGGVAGLSLVSAATSYARAGNQLPFQSRIAATLGRRVPFVLQGGSKFAAIADFAALPVAQTAVTGYEIQRIASDRNQKFGYSTNVATDAARNQVDLWAAFLFSVSAMALSRRPTTNSGLWFGKVIPGLTTGGVALAKDAFVPRLQYKLTERFREAGITNTYAQNVITRKAAKSASDNYWLTLGLSTAAAGAIFVLSRGRASKPMLLSLPAVTTSGVALYNYESTLSSEIEKRKAAGLGGLTKDDMVAYREWQQSGAIIPEAWKDSNQYRNWMIHRKDQQRRWDNFSANFFKSNRSFEGLGTQRIQNDWMISKDVLRANAEKMHSKALGKYESNPWATGSAVAGGGVLLGMMLRAQPHRMDGLAVGESFLDKKHIGKLAKFGIGELILPAVAVARKLSTDAEIRKLATRSLSPDVDGEIQFARASADISRMRDVVWQETLLAQMPLGGQSLLGRVTRHAVAHGIGKVIFDFNLNPMLLDLEQKEMLKYVRESRDKNLLTTERMQRALKAQANTNAGTIPALGLTALQMIATGRTNPMLLITGFKDSVLTYVGVKTALQSAIGKKRAVNVLLNKGNTVTGAVPDPTGASNIRAAGVSKEDEESNIVSDYFTNQFMLTTALPRLVPTLVGAGLSMWLNRRAWKHMKGATAKEAPKVEVVEPTQLPVEPEIVTPKPPGGTASKTITTTVHGEPGVTVGPSEPLKPVSTEAVVEPVKPVQPTPPAPTASPKPPQITPTVEPVVSAEPPPVASRQVISKVNPDVITSSGESGSVGLEEQTQNLLNQLRQQDSNPTGINKSKAALNTINNTPVETRQTVAQVTIQRSVHSTEMDSFILDTPDQTKIEKLVNQMRQVQTAFNSLSGQLEPVIRQKTGKDAAQGVIDVWQKRIDQLVEKISASTTNYDALTTYSRFLIELEGSFFMEGNDHFSPLHQGKIGGPVSGFGQANLALLQSALKAPFVQSQQLAFDLYGLSPTQDFTPGMPMPNDTMGLWVFGYVEGSGVDGSGKRDGGVRWNSEAGTSSNFVTLLNRGYHINLYPIIPAEVVTTKPISAPDIKPARPGQSRRLKRNYISPRGVKINKYRDPDSFRQQQASEAQSLSSEKLQANRLNSASSGSVNANSINKTYLETYKESKRQALSTAKTFVSTLSNNELTDFIEDMKSSVEELRSKGLSNLSSDEVNTYGLYSGNLQAAQLDQRRRQQLKPKSQAVEIFKHIRNSVTQDAFNYVITLNDSDLDSFIDETQAKVSQLQQKGFNAFTLEEAADYGMEVGRLRVAKAAKTHRSLEDNTSSTKSSSKQVINKVTNPEPTPAPTVTTPPAPEPIGPGKIETVASAPEITPKPLEQPTPPMLMDMVYGKAKESVTGVISKAKEIGQPFVSKVGQVARGTANQAWDGWTIFDRLEGVDARFGNQGIGGGAGFWTRFGQSAKYELSGRGIVEGGFGIGRNAQTGKVGIQGKGGAMAVAGMGLQLADDILTLDWSRKNFAKSLGTVAKNQATSLAAGVAFGLATAGLGALALSSVPALAALGVVGSAALMGYGIYSLADQGFKVGGKAWEKFVLKRKRTVEEQKAYEQQSQVLSMGFGVGTFVYAGYNQIKSLQGARQAASVVNQAPVVPTVPVRQAVDVIDDVAPRAPVSPARSGAVLKTAVPAAVATPKPNMLGATGKSFARNLNPRSLVKNPLAWLTVAEAGIGAVDDMYVKKKSWQKTLVNRGGQLAFGLLASAAVGTAMGALVALGVITMPAWLTTALVIGGLAATAWAVAPQVASIYGKVKEDFSSQLEDSKTIASRMDLNSREQASARISSSVALRSDATTSIKVNARASRDFVGYGDRRGANKELDLLGSPVAEFSPIPHVPLPSSQQVINQVNKPNRTTPAVVPIKPRSQQNITFIHKESISDSDVQGYLVGKTVTRDFDNITYDNSGFNTALYEGARYRKGSISGAVYLGPLGVNSSNAKGEGFARYYDKDSKYQFEVDTKTNKIFKIFPSGSKKTLSLPTGVEFIQTTEPGVTNTRRIIEEINNSNRRVVGIIGHGFLTTGYSTYRQKDGSYKEARIGKEEALRMSGVYVDAKGVTNIVHGLTEEKLAQLKRDKVKSVSLFGIKPVESGKHRYNRAFLVTSKKGEVQYVYLPQEVRHEDTRKYIKKQVPNYKDIVQFDGDTFAGYSLTDPKTGKAVPESRGKVPYMWAQPIFLTVPDSSVRKKDSSSKDNSLIREAAANRIGELKSEMTEEKLIQKGYTGTKLEAVKVLQGLDSDLAAGIAYLYGDVARVNKADLLNPDILNEALGKPLASMFSRGAQKVWTSGKEWLSGVGQSLTNSLTRAPIIGDLFFTPAAKAGEIPYDLMSQRQRQEAVDKEVKRRSAGSQYNLKAIQGKEQKVAKQIERPRAWWRSEDEEVPWWQKLFNLAAGAVSVTISGIGSLLKRTWNFLYKTGASISQGLSQALGGVAGEVMGPAGMIMPVMSAYQPNLTPEFREAINKTAANIGIPAEWLIGIMAFETDGTFNPAEPNKMGSGATGLIQFTPATARNMFGKSTAEMAKMSQIEQLKYVEKYFKAQVGKKKLTTFTDAYMAVLWPAAIGKGDNYTLFKRGTDAYTQNAPLDINKDGRVTAGEASAKAKAWLPGAQRTSYAIVGGAFGLGPNRVTETYITEKRGVSDQWGGPRGGRKHAGQDFNVQKNTPSQTYLGGIITRVAYQAGADLYNNYIDIYNPQLGVVERIAEFGNRRFTEKDIGKYIPPGTVVGIGSTSGPSVVHREIRTDLNAQKQGGFGYKGTVDYLKYLEERGIIRVEQIKGSPAKKVIPLASPIVLQSSSGQTQSQQVINQVQGPSTQSVSSPQVRKQLVSSLKTSSFTPLLNLMFKGEGGIESINVIRRNGDRTSNYSSTFQQQFGKSAADTTLGEIRARQRQRGTVTKTLKDGRKVSYDEIGAVGFPQLIGATLNDAMYALGFSETRKFNQQTQEQLFKYLVIIKRANLGAYLLGLEGSSLKEARQDLAREIASVPLVYPEAPLAQLQSSRISNIKDEWKANQQRQAGQSLYHGISGNVARVSGAEADKAIEQTRQLIAKDPALKAFLQKQYQEQQRLLAQQSAYQQQQSQRNVSYVPGVGAGRSKIVTNPASGVVTFRNDPDSREFVTGSDIQIGGIRNGVPIWNPIQGLTQVKPNSFQGRGRGRGGDGWGNVTRYRIDLGNNRVVEMLVGHGDRPFENYMGQGGLVPFALLGYQGNTGHATGPHATTSYKPVKGTNATAADARLVERMVQNAWTSKGSWVRVNGEWRLVKLNQAQQMGLLNGTQPSVQPSQTVKPQPVSQPARSQQQLKQSYQPAGDFKQVKATYYDPGFHGKRTAFGTIYNQNEMTVAVPRDRHNRPIIPFGTILEVVNPANGRRVYVKVTDTGSFGSMGRGLDLSLAAAQALGTIQAGVANVRYRVVKSAPSTKPQQKQQKGPVLNLPTIKPADYIPLVPTAPPPPSPSQPKKKKFNLLDPSTWLRSETPTDQAISASVMPSKMPSNVRQLRSAIPTAPVMLAQNKSTFIDDIIQINNKYVPKGNVDKDSIETLEEQYNKLFGVNVDVRDNNEEAVAGTAAYFSKKKNEPYIWVSPTLKQDPDLLKVILPHEYLHATQDEHKAKSSKITNDKDYASYLIKNLKIAESLENLTAEERSRVLHGSILSSAVYLANAVKATSTTDLLNVMESIAKDRENNKTEFGSRGLAYSILSELAAYGLQESIAKASGSKTRLTAEKPDADMASYTRLLFRIMKTYGVDIEKDLLKVPNSNKVSSNQGVLIASARVSDMGMPIIVADSRLKPKQKPVPVSFLRQVTGATLESLIYSGKGINQSSMKVLEQRLNKLFNTPGLKLQYEFRDGGAGSYSSYYNRIRVNAKYNNSGDIPYMVDTIVHEYTHARNDRLSKQYSGIQNPKEYAEAINKAYNIKAQMDQLSDAERKSIFNSAILSTISSIEQRFDEVGAKEATSFIQLLERPDLAKNDKELAKFLNESTRFVFERFLDEISGAVMGGQAAKIVGGNIEKYDLTKEEGQFAAVLNKVFNAYGFSLADNVYGGPAGGTAERGMLRRIAENIPILDLFFPPPAVGATVSPVNARRRLSKAQRAAERNKNNKDNVVYKEQRLPLWNPNDIYTDSSAVPDPTSIYNRLPKPKAPATASNVWGMPGHRPAPTGNYHDYGKRPPQNPNPVWGGPGSRPEQTGNYQDWERIPQRDRPTPPVPTVPGHRPEPWDILPPLGNIPGAVHPLDKGRKQKDDFSILWQKRKLPVPARPKQYPESIKDQIKVAIPGLIVATVSGGAVVKGGLDDDLIRFAQEAEAAVNSAAAAAIQLVQQAQEDKANAVLSFEHPITAAAVRPIYQVGQELRTKKRQLMAVPDNQDNAIYISQQVTVHAIQAQLANRDVKVPVIPQDEAASQSRIPNTRAD